MTAAPATGDRAGGAPGGPTRMRRAVIRSVTAGAAVPRYSAELAVDAAALLDTCRARFLADLGARPADRAGPAGAAGHPAAPHLTGADQ